MSNTWRQYGGIRKQDKFHNLNVGTLVADQVLLRESYAGKFIIPGSIFVGADINATGNIYGYSNTFTSFDNYVGKNLYVNKFLYFGTQNQILDGDNTHAYMFGDFSANAIGINTTTPKHALDINSTNYSQSDVLSLSTQAPQIRNKLGQNVNNRGVSLIANDSRAQIGFFVDSALNYNNTPDAQINYSIGGNMYYQSTNNNIISTQNLNLTTNGNTFITTQNILNITTGKTANINTQNTNILSTLAVSNRGQPTNMYNENTIIYDISNGLYLYDAYENIQSKAGSALTMVATDNSSNTFLRLVTPNNSGLSISSGTYPNDQTRTISAYGITDNTGKYRVNQTVVSGNSVINNYTTTGFNTYAPRTENYVLDINGPTHISNGEINKMAEIQYEILNTHFSKNATNFGIACGSPNSSTYSTIKRVNIYPQYISLTSDGGITWTPVRVDANSDFETTPKNITSIYVYDRNYAFMGSSNSFFYYTLNGGINWWLFFINDGANPRVRDAVSIYVGDYIGNVKSIFIIFKYRSLSNSQGFAPVNMLFLTTDFTKLPSASNIFINNSFYSSNFAKIDTLPISMINANDGIGNNVFFVGTGIMQYQINPLQQIGSVINTNQMYYGIMCYNNTYAVAVGTNIISYYNGTVWQNSNIPSINIILRKVHLFNTVIGMAVGDNGIFLYTNDGAQNWNIVPNSILNTSGYASRINGTYNQLRNIYITGINTMSITAVKQTYTVFTNLTNNTFSITNGMSKIYTCYIPNLYNRANNKILDVSGNMAISGDININDGGNLISNNTSFSLLNNNVNTLNLAGDANNIYIGNILSGKTYVQHNLDVSGNTVLHGSLGLTSDFNMTGNLSVGKSGFVNNDLSINKRLYVGMDASFLGNLYVEGILINGMNFEYMSTLTVENTMYCKEHLIVYQDVSINGNVYIGGPNIVNCITTRNSNKITGETIDTITIGGTVSGTGIPSGTYVTAINTKTYIITLNNNVTVDSTKNPLSFVNTKIFDVTPDVSLNARLYVDGDVSFNNKLSVLKDISLNGNLVMYNSTSKMTLNPNSITYNYGSGNTNTLPLSQFQYIQTLTQSVQEVLNVVTSKTGPIGITTGRDFTVTSTSDAQTNRDFTIDSITMDTITSNLTSNAQSINIDPVTLGVANQNIVSNQQQNTSINASRAITLLTFDVNNNNVLVAGNLIPTSDATISFGTQASPFDTIYLNNQDGINFIDTNGSQGKLSFNTTTGYLDLTNNGITGSTLLTYGGNVAIGKQFPNTNLDVLGTSIFNGDIKQQTGDLYLNNRLFINSDISVNGNFYAYKNTYNTGDLFLSSRLFATGDVSVNSNLFVLKDVSLNNRLYVGSDTSLNGNLYVAKTINIIGDTSLNSRLFVNNDTVLNSNLFVANKTILNKDLSLNGNIVVNGMTFLNNDEYLQGNLFVTNDQFLNGNIIIYGSTTIASDTNINSRLFLSKDASLNNRLFVKGTGFFNTDVYLNNNAYINKDLSLNGNINVGGNFINFNNDASINGNLYLQNNLFANKDISLTGILNVNNQATFNKDINVNNRLILGGDASFSSNLYLNNRLYVNNDSLINGNLYTGAILTSSGDVFARSRLFVNLDTSLNGNLYVDEYTILNNDASINGNISIQGALIRSNAYVNGSMIVYNDTSLNANLLVGGNVLINGNLRTNQNLSVKNITNTGSITTLFDNNTNGNVNIGVNLLVNNNAIINNSLTVGGNTNIIGNLNVANDLSVNGTLNVKKYLSGSIPLGAIAGGSGLALGSFANDVNIGKNFFVAGDTTLYGNLTVVQNFTLIGEMYIKQYTVNQTITTLSYEVMIAEDLSLGGRLYMTGDASINERLFVGADVSMNANLYVGGRTTFAQPITIGNTLTINGNVIQNGRVTNNALSLFNGDISLNSRLFVFGGSNFINDVSMNTRLYVQNDTSLNSNLFVQGISILQSDVSMNTRLYVQNDTSLNGNLFTRGITILQSDVSMNTRLYVQNDTSLNGNLFTRGRTTLNSDVSMNNRLYVQNDTNLNSRLIVQGQSILNNDVSMNYRLYVKNDVSMGSNLYINGNTILNNDVSMNARLYVENDVSLGSNLYVDSLTTLNADVSMNSRLFIANDLSVGGNFYVTGKTIHQKDVSFNKFLYGTDASYTGNVAIYGNLYLHTDLRFDNLYVKQVINGMGNVYIKGQSTQMVDASLNGNLNVILDTSLNGRLAVAQDASFNSNINVLLDTSLNGRLYVGLDSSMNGNLFVAKNTIIQGNSIQNGDVSMVSSLDLNGSMIARNNMNVYGIINQYNTVATPANTIVNNTSYVTSNAQQVTLGTTASQNIYVPGNIGIGTNTPQTPLYINKGASSTGQDNGFYYNNTNSTSTNINTTSPYNYSIYAINSIATADKLIATTSVYFSDERIKTDIEDINTEYALETVRKIEPKKYKYMDQINNGSEPTWGFVAQQVKNVLEYSVSTSKNFIPDIYELCQVIGDNTIVLEKKRTNILTTGTKIKAISIDKTELIFTIKRIVDDRIFIIEESIKRSDIYIRIGKIFIYGQEIEDFNNLDKNTIFTITTAALKQVDKELQETKSIVEEQKQQITELQKQMKMINAKLRIF